MFWSFPTALDRYQQPEQWLQNRELMMQVVPSLPQIQNNFYQQQNQQQQQQQQSQQHQQEQQQSYIPIPVPKIKFDSNYLVTPEQTHLRLRSSPFQVVPSPSGSYVSTSDEKSPTMFSPTENDQNFRPNEMTDFCNIESFRQNRLSSVDSSQTSVSPSYSTFYDSFQEMNDFISAQVSPMAEPSQASHNNALSTTRSATEVQPLKSEVSLCDDHPLDCLQFFNFETKNENWTPDCKDSSKSELNPIIALAMDQLKKEIDNTCTILGIVPDPSRWSICDVAVWMDWTMQQFGIPTTSTNSSTMVQDWSTDGAGFVQLTEQEFKDKLPQGGEKVYAQLDLWRTSANYHQGQGSSDTPTTTVAQIDQMHHHSYHEPVMSPAHQHTSITSTSQQQQHHQQQQQQQQLQQPSYDSRMSINELMTIMDASEGRSNIPDHLQQQQQIQQHQQHLHSQQQHHYQYPEVSMTEMSSRGMLISSQADICASMEHSQSTMMNQYQINKLDTGSLSSRRDYPTRRSSVTQSTSHNRASTSHHPSTSTSAMTSHASAMTSPTPAMVGRSNIHLWQFIKELLNDPQVYSGCIHWVDREKGIFKIVDSLRVAYLWGKRKNRPAMNFDKLSRSLRQYYKKGIMKKTDRPQRLVYQLCSPYHH